MNVGWLHSILNDIAEMVESSGQKWTLEVAKANCDHELELIKKELESQMQDLTRKEKEVNDAKAKVADTRAHLSELEFKYFQLNKEISSLQFKNSRAILLRSSLNAKRICSLLLRVLTHAENLAFGVLLDEYCFKVIAEVKARNQKNEPVPTSSEAVQAGRSSGSSNFVPPDEYEDLHDEKPDEEGHSDGDVGKFSGEENVEGDFTKLTGRKKKLFEIRLKMNEARKANQTAIATEKKKMEPPSESRGISKQKWLEDRKKKIGKLLDANGLDMTKAYMLDTQEAAESKYKKWEKDPAPYGWDVFNQKTLYNAYKKRTKNVNVDLEEYNKMKESDPEFYREASSLQYGKAPKISEDKIDNMVNELKDRDEKRKSFSHTLWRSKTILSEELHYLIKDFRGSLES
ncbi:unnamed protein product [Citrullus colocynthis]|uniref:Pre-mRNA-splicing factor SYF2 n=1 Tax=Citrullus colocynthis TaxID=252529 RepID=A0ABP0Y848_9ROSI